MRLTREMHAYEAHAYEMHADKVQAYETHAGEMHAHEIVPAYEIYAGEVHAHEILWWGGSHPCRGVLVWSEQLNRWHSPIDKQSSILSQSFPRGDPPLCWCCPRAQPLYNMLREGCVSAATSRCLLGLSGAF
jgi:hypothetical protein